MADRWAVATGNWSSTATWDGGTLPTAADDVYADGYTVTIDQNVTVLSIRTTQRSGGTAGGGFVLSSGVTLTANVIAGTSTCLSRSSTGAASNIVGNITGGSANPSAGFNNSSPATTNITGNIITTSANTALVTTAGVVNVTGNTSHVNQNGYCIVVSGTATFNITGTVTAGSFNYASVISVTGGPCYVTINGNLISYIGTYSGIWQNTGLATITINGNVISYGGTPIYGLNTNTTLVINGNATASTTASCVANVSLTQINGNMYSASNGVIPIPGRMLINPTAQVEHSFVANSSGNPGAVRTMYTGGVNLGQPTAANVRQGTTFGVSNEFTGTLAVPPAGSVALGVPVDNTTGTASITAANIRAAIGLSSANLDTQLATVTERTNRIPNNPATSEQLTSLQNNAPTEAF